MAQHLERELKFCISGPTEFDRVLQFLGPARKVSQQINTYFSTASDEVAEDWSLRLRQEDQRAELTLKQGRQQSQGYFQAIEIQCCLDQTQVDELLNQPVWSESIWELPPLQVLRRERCIRRLSLLGTLHNQRYSCPQKAGWVAELDITKFSQERTDYELEVETDDVEAVLGALKPLREYLIPQSQTKFCRFLKYRNL